MDGYSHLSREDAEELHYRQSFASLIPGDYEKCSFRLDETMTKIQAITMMANKKRNGDHIIEDISFLEDDALVCAFHHNYGAYSIGYIWMRKSDVMALILILFFFWQTLQKNFLLREYKSKNSRYTLLPSSSAVVVFIGLISCFP